jgi:hypothetical protein
MFESCRTSMDHHDGFQDHRDALARARLTYTRKWHPMLSAVETEPGVWLMVAQFGEPYAIIRLIEIGKERGYRVVTASDKRADRELIGYYMTLRAATAAAHARWIRQHGTLGGVNGQT